MNVQTTPANRSYSIQQVLEQEAVRTYFQPIVTFSTEVPERYAVEALTRGPKNTPLESPLDLFNAAEQSNQLYDLERVARQKAIERLVDRFEDTVLFLNLDPNVIYDSSFRGGNTINYLREYGIDRSNVVFEITERNQVKDRDAFEEAILHYREQGFRIAVDDVGSGYSNLDTIARLQPDFIKIDMNLIRDLHLNRSQIQLVETITSFADRIGSTVIAEGIEVKEELQTLLSMGIEYGQGYFLSRPAPVPNTPDRVIEEIHGRCRATTTSRDNHPTLGTLARPSGTFTPDTHTEEVYECLTEDSQDRSVVVLQDKKPVGLVMRDHLSRKLSTNVGQSLYWDRPVSNVMDADPLVLPANTKLDEASEQISSRPKDHFYDEVIVVNPETGEYQGNVTVQQILEKMTQLKTRKARRANPLTGLPGNLQLQDRLQQYLDAKRTFALIYVDLDHFKPFNDYYGFERGDQAILLLKNVLEDGLQVHPSPINFLGHIGGDDFVAITVPEYAEPFCEYVIKQFDERILELYDEDDREDGYIRTEDRSGEVREFNRMTVSLAVVDNSEQTFENHLRMSEVAAERKKVAKRNRRESSYVLNRENPLTKNGCQTTNSDGE